MCMYRRVRPVTSLRLVRCYRGVTITDVLRKVMALQISTPFYSYFVYHRREISAARARRMAVHRTQCTKAITSSMSWMPQPSLTLQWNAELDDAWLQAHAVHGAPSKLSIAGYRSLLPGKSDQQIYGRGSYYCGSMGLPKIAQAAACYTALRALSRSAKAQKKRPASRDVSAARAQKMHKNGPFTCEEDDEYLTLLNDYGQPTKSNAEAEGKFASTFPQRSMPSIKAHINAFERVQSDDGKPARWEKVLCR